MKPLDNSTLTAYRECPRKAYFRYVKHWRQDGTEPIYFSFGSAWHAGLDALYSAFYEARSASGPTGSEWNRVRQSSEFANAMAEIAMSAFATIWVEAGWPLEPTPDEMATYKGRTPVKAKEMYFYYYKELAEHMNRWNLIATEQPFCVPLDLENEKIFYSGRIDKVIEDETGQLWLLEHKTSTMFSKTTGFRYDFVQSFSPNSQIEGYMYAVLFMQHMNELPNDREFGGVYVDASLVHKTQFHFKRIPIYYNDLLVAEWLDDVRYWYQSFRESEENTAFPRSPHSCQSKFGQCSFINLCRTKPCIKDLPEDPPEGFVVDEWKPFTMETVDGDK